ncbi:MAG: Cell division protein FtsN [Rhodocyclaceae bacterium]|nr:Cell division protein FtsN [Rhodocyclaceae bacterium]
MSQKSPTSVRRHPSPPRKSAGGTLLGVFIGIVIGVVISAAVVWYINGAPSPFRDKMQPAESLRGDLSKGPANLPAKPGEPALEPKPSVEPNKTPTGQDGQGVAAIPAEPGETAKVAATEQTFLQAGAFHSAAEADNLKAKLALLGLEASVQQVSVPDKGNVFRVRLGPYAKPEDLARVRAELAQNGIQANLVKSSQ